ncbi:unnamed protein product [Acanthosepion pharaonis]|uniref:Uncharacterized protein n=1 Tax=Acanthosepion pharaonis TaxID=158019 RepID=A0A812B9C1_ACAPH|nr:unnamed protein product [Sepia pharaonis]
MAFLFFFFFFFLFSLSPPTQLIFLPHSPPTQLIFLPHSPPTQLIFLPHSPPTQLIFLSLFLPTLLIFLSLVSLSSPLNWVFLSLFPSLLTLMFFLFLFVFPSTSGFLVSPYPAGFLVLISHPSIHNFFYLSPIILLSLTTTFPPNLLSLSTCYFVLFHFPYSFSVIFFNSILSFSSHPSPLLSHHQPPLLSHHQPPLLSHHQPPHPSTSSLTINLLFSLTINLLFSLTINLLFSLTINLLFSLTINLLFSLTINLLFSPHQPPLHQPSTFLSHHHLSPSFSFYPYLSLLCNFILVCNLFSLISHLPFTAICLVSGHPFQVFLLKMELSNPVLDHWSSLSLLISFYVPPTYLLFSSFLLNF